MDEIYKSARYVIICTFLAAIFAIAGFTLSDVSGYKQIAVGFMFLWFSIFIGESVLKQKDFHIANDMFIWQCIVVLVGCLFSIFGIAT